MTTGRSASLCWSLLSVCVLLVSADQKNIAGTPGQTVILPCRAPNNKTITGVEWSRPDLGEEYVFLYRGNLEPYKQHSSFKNRVDLQDRQMKDGDVSLILKNVTTADSGTYEVRVNREANRRKRAYLSSDPICTFNLSVVPPGQPGGHTQDGNFGPVSYIGVILGVCVCVCLFVCVFVAIRRYKKHSKKKSFCSLPKTELV